jgi:hypothetical protein
MSEEEQVNENDVHYVRLEPMWSNIPTWFFVVNQMIEGHSKRTKEMSRNVKKELNHSSRFQKARYMALEEIDFWTSLEELCTREIQECEIQRVKNNE